MSADDAADPATDSISGRVGTLLGARSTLLVAMALAAAALLVAGVFGVLWVVAANDDNAGLAQAREDVVRAGGSAVKTFTELDYTRQSEIYDQQLQVSTGELSEQVSKARDSYTQAIEKAKTKVVTTIDDIAVEELDDREGKAALLAAIRTDITQGDQQSSKVLRLEAQLTRVDQDGDQVWKLSAIGSVPVVSSGQ